MAQLRHSARQGLSSPSTSCFLGIEIGSRGQRVVVAGNDGRVFGRAHAVNGSAPAREVIAIVAALAEQAIDEAGIESSEIARAGIAFGGPVDALRGITLLSHRAAGYEDYPLVSLIEERLGVPAVLDNGARAAALGESMFGSARGLGDLVYVHLSTGVGAGIIVDGHLLHGDSSTAGEIGHMVVSNGGPLCSCGKPGHLEAYASAPAIVERFVERLRESADSEVNDWSRRRSITVSAIFAAAHSGDAIAQSIVTETVQVLGIAIANLITILNPAAVVIGGSVSDVGSLLMEPLSARVRQYSFPAAARRVRLMITQHGPEATVLGGVALALASLELEPSD